MMTLIPPVLDGFSVLQLVHHTFLWSVLISGFDVSRHVVPLSANTPERFHRNGNRTSDTIWMRGQLQQAMSASTSFRFFVEAVRIRRLIDLRITSARIKPYLFWLHHRDLLQDTANLVIGSSRARSSGRSSLRVADIRNYDNLSLFKRESNVISAHETKIKSTSLLPQV